MPKSTELARRIHRLFDVIHKRTEPPLTTREAAISITAQAGVPISAAALEALRAGDTTDATEAQLSAVAEFFGVPPKYLIDTDSEAGVDAQLTLLRAMREAGGPQKTG